MGDTQLFLVRVWQHLSRFHASVRSVDQDEPRLFTEPEQVSEFLRNAAAAPTTQPEGGFDEEQS